MIYRLALLALASTADAAGTCTDAADQSAWKGGGQKSFTDDMTTCGKKCLGGKSCVSKCLQGKDKYSAPCADCFGGLAACTESHCLAPCLKVPTTKACADCQNKNCVPTFVSCSGIPQSDLPPPPKSLFNATAATAATACTDAADQKIWTSKGEKAFESDMTSCGKQCMGADACVTKCIKSKEGYTDTCSSCFGSLGGCTTKHCLTQCIAGNNPACTKCQVQYCATPFHDCSGLTPPPGTSNNATLKLKSQGTATCKTTPKTCTGVCTIEEAAPVKGSDLHIDISGDCATETVTGATYDIKLVFGGLPILSKTAQDATKANTYDLPLKMGSIEIPAVKLPVAAGTKILLPGIAHIGKLAPSGKLVASIDAFDQDKKALFSFEVDISF